MLVLSRKISEAIRINEGIEITILGVSRGRVKLGFKAPQGVSIQRAEVAMAAAASEFDLEAAMPAVGSTEQTNSPRYEMLAAVVD